MNYNYVLLLIVGFLRIYQCKYFLGLFLGLCFCVSVCVSVSLCEWVSIYV